MTRKMTKKTDPAQTRKATESGKDRPRKPKWREHAESLGVAVILFLIVRTFLLQAFRIPSESMENTLLKGDFLFVNKFLYGAKVPGINVRLPGIRDPRRGDVVVFKSPTTGQDYIKRCVAVAGDTVVVRDNTLYINGDPQSESYTKFVGRPRPGVADWPLNGRGYYVVPDGYFFAMGDNRNNSRDSRFFHTDGAPESAVPVDDIVGKAIFIYFSVKPVWELRGLPFGPPRLNRMFHLVR